MFNYFQNLLGGYQFQYSHLAILVGVLLALYFLWGYMRKPSMPQRPYGPPDGFYPGGMMSYSGFQGINPQHQMSGSSSPGHQGPQSLGPQGPQNPQSGNVGPQSVQYEGLPPMPSSARYAENQPEACSPPMDYVNQSTQTGGASNKTLVLYYAPWCGFCKKFMPVWEDLSSRYGERLQKVDCEAYPDEAEKQNIEAFPTIILFVDGKRVRVLKGGADAETIESLMA